VFRTDPSPAVFLPRRPLATSRTVIALILREMATTYGRSPGGYIWAVAEPAAGILLLTLIFSLAFRSPPLGQNFPIFYATGVVPFMMFNDVSNKLAQALNFSRPLLAYPSVTFADAVIARFVLNVFTQVMVAYVTLGGIILIFDTRTVANLPAIALALAMSAVLALGVGTLNCFLMTRFALWQRAWSVLTRPLFIISCIFFLFESVPRPTRDFLWYNPLVHIIGQMRHGFYVNYDASYVSPLYVFGIGLGLTAFGLVLLARYHRRLLAG